MLRGRVAACTACTAYVVQIWGCSSSLEANGHLTAWCGEGCETVAWLEMCSCVSHVNVVCRLRLVPGDNFLIKVQNLAQSASALFLRHPQGGWQEKYSIACLRQTY
jgi:hypothetical protein